MKLHSYGWVCTDCIMLLANGEDNPEWSEEESETHHKAMNHSIGDLSVFCGGEHEPFCENVEWECEHCHIIMTDDMDDVDCPNGGYGWHNPIYKSWIGTSDCDCETEDFSWSSCDTCNSHLGGSRHAVTFFERN